MRLCRRSATVTILVAGALAVCASTLAGASVIHIPADQPTIAAGLAAASPGDMLLLADGSYHEHGMIITLPVTIASEHGPGYSGIYGDSAGRIFWVEGADGVVFSGLTVRGGLSDFGAAVYADSANITIDNCVFTDNHATSEGGALFLNRGTATLTSTNIVTNSAAYGGGGAVVNAADGDFTFCHFGNNEALWGGGVAVYHPGATPVFDYCTFQENHAVGTEPYGGGAYCWNYAAPTFTNCDFIDNTSEYGGGGLMSDEECQLTVTLCTFTGNSAIYGGGIETWWTRGGSVTGCEFTGNTAQDGGGVLHEQSQNLPFTDCTFTDNVATGSGGGFSLLTSSPGPSDCTFTGNSAEFGGGILVQYCTTPLVSGCTFIGNTAEYGGAITIDTCDSPAVADCTAAENTADYGGAIAITGCSTPSLSRSTLVRNRGNVFGGGIAIEVGTTLSVDRSIIAFSTAGEAIASDGPTVNCATTAVYGNAGGDWVGCIAGQETGNNNIATDPLLCGILTGDYTLCQDSPCLPENNGAGVLVGVYGQGCDPPCAAPVEARSWGSIKAMYR
jgi:predicted outer membrane repeat protein